ncbi:MAG: hypothetical protein IJ719_22490 [Clostridia bacterium]|nr:hypothetical protein [Clostridia bacterium]
MNESIPIINQTMNLGDCRDKWSFDEAYNCWCLEDVLYTAKADVPKFQRLSIFVPKAYMNPDGTCTPQSKHVPIIFENNAAGYMQMPHTWLGGPRCYAERYLNHGLIYITCGCRGRESRNAHGELVGKSPISLIDLKTALRFLRHNKAILPGDFDKIISIGWSAGGAMSTLLGVTGDNERYLPYLSQNGAFMEESDSVFAAQIYCPIIDLEHADLAYEWCFLADTVSEDCMCGPAETMSPFKEALSRKLAQKYMDYVNSLGLRHPQSGEPLTLQDVRSGRFYDYLMDCLSASASRFLANLPYPPEDYLTGNYTYMVPAPHGGNAHHAGPDVVLDERPMSLGDMVSRPPRGTPYVEHKPEMIKKQGSDKRSWLSWDGQKATISSLDTYVLQHRRRMKPCTAFDALGMDSGENHVFGSPETDYAHFCSSIGEAIQELSKDFPEEAKKYAAAFDLSGDADLTERVYLLNPMNFIGTEERSNQAKHYRIRVGASDADTSFTISMTLAIRLANAGYPVDYALVWDQPHSEADYPGEILQWIDRICKEAECSAR